MVSKVSEAIQWVHERNVANKKYLLQSRVYDDYPKYYPLTGFAAKAADFFEAPQRRIERIESLRLVWTLQEKVTFVVFRALAVFSSIVSRFIHYCSAELIKKSDYDSAFADWVEKKDWIGHDIGKCKKFIDLCIQHRITAEQCPYQAIGSYNLNSGMVFSWFDGDGRLANVDLYLAAKKIEALILFTPQTRNYEDWSADAVKRNVLENSEATRKPRVQEHCEMVSFKPWGLTDQENLNAFFTKITVK
jgi:hypothetical protein